MNKVILRFLLTVLSFQIVINTMASEIDSIQIIYHTSTGEFGGYARRIILITEDEKSFCHFDEFNTSTPAVIPRDLTKVAKEKEMTQFYENQKVHKIANRVEVTPKEKSDFLSVIDSIYQIAHLTDHIFSNAINQYAITKNGLKHVIIDYSGEYKFARQLESTLNLRKKALYVRMIPRDNPSLYSLDGLQVPYEMIKQVIVNEDIINISFDRAFTKDIFHGLYNLNTSLFVVLHGKILRSKREKKKHLSDIDYRKINIKRLSNREASIKYGNKITKDVLLISLL